MLLEGSRSFAEEHLDQRLASILWPTPFLPVQRKYAGEHERPHRSHPLHWTSRFGRMMAGPPQIPPVTKVRQNGLIADRRRKKRKAPARQCPPELFICLPSCYLPLVPKSLPTPVTKSYPVPALKLPAEPEVISRKSAVLARLL